MPRGEASLRRLADFGVLQVLFRKAMDACRNFSIEDPALKIQEEGASIEPWRSYAVGGQLLSRKNIPAFSTSGTRASW